MPVTKAKRPDSKGGGPSRAKGGRGVAGYTPAQIDRLYAQAADPGRKWIKAEDVPAHLASGKIRLARLAAKMSQRTLGEKVGLSQETISRIERDADRATLGVLRKLAAALKVDVRGLI
ncbi:MAG: helix-turn-helix transcriptional regulator [Phycisphaerales bacterium]|nr:helix-turn-helix transcriptional regulator [Phycisphaerales bacterium]